MTVGSIGRWWVVLLVSLLAACGDAAPSGTTEASAVTVPETAATMVATTVSTTTTTTTTSSTEPSFSCDAPAYLPWVLPERAFGDQPAPATIDFDMFTAIPGTGLALWHDESGRPAVAVVRGALPPVDFIDDQERVEILESVPALLGRLTDEGHWGVAWAFTREDPCDRYSLIVYPPTNVDEVREIAAGLR